MTLGTSGGEDVAQRRLQSLIDGLGKTDLEEEVNQAARLLRAELPSLPDYADLDADHRAYYDIATGLRAAVALLSPAILRANEGLSKLKTPDFEYTFTVPSLTERESLATEMAQAVGYLVRLVRSLQPRPRRHVSMFGAAGIATQRERRLQRGGDVVRLLVPDGWVEIGWFGADVCGLGEG